MWETLNLAQFFICFYLFLLLFFAQFSVLLFNFLVARRGLSIDWRKLPIIYITFQFYCWHWWVIFSMITWWRKRLRLRLDYTSTCICQRSDSFLDISTGISGASGGAAYTLPVGKQLLSIKPVSTASESFIKIKVKGFIELAWISEQQLIGLNNAKAVY